MSKLQFAQSPECVFSAVGNIEETIIILLLIVDCRHDCPCWRQHIVNKYEYCLFCTQFDSFTNDIDKLPNCQVSWHKILFLIDIRNITFFSLFNYHLHITEIL
uniref:Putative ovule protein n=1 Tax=Solanum chacoense TaxID=4108 RepID=A0A0V0H8P0_SOLCH